MQRLSDEELLATLPQASPEARRAVADELFGRHYERVARWCYRFAGDRDAAADIAQEVFLKAHRHLDSFQHHSRFTTWLYTIVRNESLNWLKRRRPASVADSDEMLREIPAPEPGPEEIAAGHSRARHLHRLLASTLNETERIVFTLHYGEDMPLDAITRMLGLQNASGAKASIVSARRKLARAIRRREAEGERPWVADAQTGSAESNERPSAFRSNASAKS